MADSPKEALLFTKEGFSSVYNGDPATHQRPGSRRNCRRARGAKQVRGNQATTHVDDQSVIVIHGDHAVSETYCLAHGLLEENGVPGGKRWLFAERKLIVDWSDTRPSVA
jgi:hypothetical protein